MPPDTLGLRTSPLSGIATPYQLRKLVLDYLCHQCYTKTATALARESTVRQLDADGNEISDSENSNFGTNSVELSEGCLRQVEIREKVRTYILAGRVDDATALLNEHFPSVLSGPIPAHPAPDARLINSVEYAALTSIDPAHLTLNLRILAFIEACRTIPLEYPRAVSRPQAPATSISEHSASDEESSQFLEHRLTLLSKAKKLLNLANKLPNAADRTLYLKELNNVGGLLAYKVPEDSSISKYLSQERREAVADQINRAVLGRSGMSSVSSLELLARHTSTVWSFAHQVGVRSRTGVLLPPVLFTPVSQKEQEIVPLFDLHYFANTK